MSQSPRIVWFKRDLRVQDNAPFLAALHSNRPTIPLYIVEPEYWQQPFASRRHWHFIHDCLINLNKDLTELGRPLVIQVGDAIDVIERLQNQFGSCDVFTHVEAVNAWT